MNGDTAAKEQARSIENLPLCNALKLASIELARQTGLTGAKLVDETEIPYPHLLKVNVDQQLEGASVSIPTYDFIKGLTWGAFLKENG